MDHCIEQGPLVEVHPQENTCLIPIQHVSHDRQLIYTGLAPLVLHGGLRICMAAPMVLEKGPWSPFYLNMNIC